MLVDDSDTNGEKFIKNPEAKLGYEYRDVVSAPSNVGVVRGQENADDTYTVVMDIRDMKWLTNIN